MQRDATDRTGSDLDRRVLVQVHQYTVVGLVDQIFKLDLDVCTRETDAASGNRTK